MGQLPPSGLLHVGQAHSSLRGSCQEAVQPKPFITCLTRWPPCASAQEVLGLDAGDAKPRRMYQTLSPCSGSTVTHAVCCRNALAFGENSAGTANPFIGAGDFAMSKTDDYSVGDRSWSLFLFHWAFSAAAATIMAGAVAERMTLLVYLGYTCMMTTLVSAGNSLLPCSLLGST